MAYTSLNQMYTHILDPVRGWWDERQLSAVLPSNASNPDQMFAGMVGDLVDNSGVAEFRIGITEAGTGTTAATTIPLFLRNNVYKGSGSSEYNDNNVRSVTGGISGNSGAPTAVAGDQGVSVLVGTGGYELASSEFIGTLNVGDRLTAKKHDHGTAANLGKITDEGESNVKFGEKTFFGIVSKKGVAGSSSTTKNYRGTPIVTFYTHLFQVTAETNTSA